MDEAILKSIAEQLRKPEGEYAVEVAEKMNEGNRFINLHTIDALELTAGDNILEIGMANGFFVKNILAVHHSITYTGCDFSETMIEEASRLNESFLKTGRAKFQHAAISNLPFEDKQFSKIFTVNTLYFWDDIPAVLSEIRRVLKPGGQFIIAVRPKSVMEKYPFTKYGFRMYSEKEIVEILSANNFNVFSTIRKNEPDQQIGEETIKVETLIVCADRD